MLESQFLELLKQLSIKVPNRCTLKQDESHYYELYYDDCWHFFDPNPSWEHRGVLFQFVAEIIDAEKLHITLHKSGDGWDAVVAAPDDPAIDCLTPVHDQEVSIALLKAYLARK